MGEMYCVGIRLDSDCFLVDETGVFAAVFVGEVHGVAGELDAAGLFAFAEVGVIFACIPHDIPSA